MSVTVELDVDGPGAPPRSNGELVFAEPWESKAFGLAMNLNQSGAFAWDDFRDQLISRIARWEAGHPEGECFSYYRCWVQALEDVVTARAMLDPGDVDRRARELAARPAGWDHDHDHDDHDH